LLKDFWIDSGRLNIKVRKKDLKMSQYDLKFTIMVVVNTTAGAYYDLIAARDQIEVQKIAVQLKEQLLAANKKKMQVGTMAPCDEKQAESEAAKARSDLITAQFDAERAENI